LSNRLTYNVSIYDVISYISLLNSKGKSFSKILKIQKIALLQHNYPFVSEQLGTMCSRENHFGSCIPDHLGLRETYFENFPINTYNIAHIAQHFIHQSECFCFDGIKVTVP